MAAFVWLLPQLMLGQSRIDLDIAESYYRAGKIDKALELYESLYRQKPGDSIYLDRYRQALFNLQKYDKLIDVLKDEITRQPQNQILQFQLAQCYYLKSMPDKGDELLEAILKKAQSVTAFNDAFYVLEQVKYYERIERFVEIGRKKFQNPDIFAHQAAAAYLFLADYPKATKEYLRLFRSGAGDFYSVQSNILSYATEANPDILHATIKAVEEEKPLFKDSSRLLLSQILLRLYLEAKDYEGAFRENTFLDDGLGANGGQLLGFAEQSLAEKEFDMAIKAYQTAVEKSRVPGNVSQARFGYAKTLELQAQAEPDTAKRRVKYGRALLAYTEYEKAYPVSNKMPDVLLSIVRISIEALGNKATDSEAVQKLQTRYSYFPQAYAAQVLMAKQLVRKNKISEALTLLEALKSSPYGDEESRAEAAYLLGKLNFYKSSFNDATALLATVPLRTSVGNDAVQLRLLIVEALADSVKNENAVKSLADFVEVFRLEDQYQLTAALEKLAKWLEQNPNSSLVDDALEEKARLEEMNSPREAVKTYEQLLKDYPQSFYADKALFQLGRIHEEKLSIPEKAISYYQRLISDYPKSLYAKDARARLRQLMRPS